MRSSPKSEGNLDKSESEDASNSDRKNVDSRNKENFEKDFDEKQLHSGILFKSNNEFDSGEGRTYDVGLDTLNVIEHMEMLDSVAGILLNKDGIISDVRKALNS